MVDTGYRHHPEEALTPALRRLGFALRDVDLILATRTSYHIGGVRWTVDGSGAEVLAHPADRWLFAGPEVHRRPGIVHDLIGLLTSLQETERALEWDAMLLKNVGSSVIVHRSLDDGDVIDLGAGPTITVIHTPGHKQNPSPMINPGGVALTGDTIQGRGYRLGLPLYQDPGASEGLSATFETRASPSWPWVMGFAIPWRVRDRRPSCVERVSTRSWTTARHFRPSRPMSRGGCWPTTR